jgi:hypothetical protein
VKTAVTFIETLSMAASSTNHINISFGMIICYYRSSAVTPGIANKARERKLIESCMVESFIFSSKQG